MPIFHGDRVLATVGLTYFRSAVSAKTLEEVLVPALRTAVEGIEASYAILVVGTKSIAPDGPGTPKTE
jgi:IclR family mhp operon transcriptional activator